MFRHIGENKTADLIENAFGKAILCKKVTYDLARQMKDAKEVKCSEFAEEVVKKLHESV
jgi:isocitrate dehydrogenase